MNILIVDLFPHSKFFGKTYIKIFETKDYSDRNNHIAQCLIEPESSYLSEQPDSMISKKVSASSEERLFKKENLHKLDLLTFSELNLNPVLLLFRIEYYVPKKRRSRNSLCC